MHAHLTGKTEGVESRGLGGKGEGGCLTMSGGGGVKSGGRPQEHSAFSR